MKKINILIIISLLAVIGVVTATRPCRWLNSLNKTMSKNKITLQYLAKNISIILGIVLVQRGVWYVLDELDKWIFGGSHLWTALGGILIGLIVLYLPDKDLKEIEKL